MEALPLPLEKNRGATIGYDVYDCERHPTLIPRSLSLKKMWTCSDKGVKLTPQYDVDTV